MNLRPLGSLTLVTTRKGNDIHKKSSVVNKLIEYNCRFPSPGSVPASVRSTTLFRAACRKKVESRLTVAFVYQFPYLSSGHATAPPVFRSVVMVTLGLCFPRSPIGLPRSAFPDVPCLRRPTQRRRHLSRMRTLLFF